jgi:hypothetical protein
LHGLEEVLGDVPTNVAPKVRAFLARVAKVEARQFPEHVDEASSAPFSEDAKERIKQKLAEQIR